MKGRDWSLSKLARESGVPVATIHGWVAGRTRPDLGQLKKVATTLEVSIHELAFGESDPFETPGDEVLKEIFSGDVRISLHRIERRKK